MRHPFPSPPPTVEALKALRVHEAVRDYPELLPVLRSQSVRLPGQGCELLAEVVPPEEDEKLFLALAWRREGDRPGPPPPAREP